MKSVENAYAWAKERYAAIGVDTEAALLRLASIPISLHCWQGDDIGGFESNDAELGGGLAVTGRYPGKPRTADELRADIDKALSLIPGRHRLNLHASYAETGGRVVDRDAIEPAHFARWIDWASERGLGLDFNPTYFAHAHAADGFTLAHADPAIRAFWVEHGIRCREIAAAMGRATGGPCVCNVWVPDGMKDQTIDRAAPRARLAESLDQVFAQAYAPTELKDAVEAKLFGIGSESYVVGSHEFYLGYAITRKKTLCLDAGHFHPTEVISDKISSVLMYVPELLLHVSRGIRWDSDHVVLLTDEVAAIAQEVVRNNFLPRVRFGLDFFDASINRVAAWIIGTRAILRAILAALLEPTDELRTLENEGDFTARLATLEELKSLPAGVVWDMHCLRNNVPVGLDWIADVRLYEHDVLALRDRLEYAR